MARGSLGISRLNFHQELQGTRYTQLNQIRTDETYG
jgi:hypothetical protein